MPQTARLVANGATLGYGDKIAAGMDSLFGQGDYASNLAPERAQSQAAVDRAGWAGTAWRAWRPPAGAIGKALRPLATQRARFPLSGGFSPAQ